MKSERLSAEHNSIVPSGIKLDFVLDEMQRIKYKDPEGLKYISDQIKKAREIMSDEWQKCVNVGLDVELADTQRVDAIIDDLFIKYVCQSTS